MNQQTPTQAEIKERLVGELNIAHLRAEEQDDIITKMSTILLDRITMAVVAELPKEEMARVDKLLGAGQTDAVQALIAKQVPNAPDIAEVIIAETMGEYKEVIQRLSTK